MSNGPWTDEENDLIVADYFAMLADDIAGHRYNKAEHRRALLPLLNERSEGSVEFKHQNISAVLKGLGEDWTWTACLDPVDGKIVWMRAHGERWKTICWTVGLQRSAAHQHWLYGLCVISLKLNRRRFNRNLSKRRVIELAGGA